jgi:YjbE family integral membrane protein
MCRLNPGGERLAIAEGPPVRLDATGDPKLRAAHPDADRDRARLLMEVFTAAGFSALLQVIAIDLVLAGDNAIVIGMAAAGLPKILRRKAIMVGIAAATVLRIGFALVTTWLLQLGPALLVAGGLLLLWVCWKMWRELRTSREEELHGTAALDGDGDNGHAPAGKEIGKPSTKTFSQAAWQIVIADVSMSLDNVLAVAGAAMKHPVVLVFGLLLSIALMGLAAAFVARLLHRYRWIAYVGLVIIFYVALKMIYDGMKVVDPDLFTRLVDLPGALLG